MISAIKSFYSPHYAKALVYMLQSVEYRIRPYLAWYWRTQDFSKVEHRGELELTRPARLLVVALWLGMSLQVLAGLVLIYLWFAYGLTAGSVFGLAAILAYPVVWAHLIAVPLILGRVFIVAPKEWQAVRRSEQVFKNHQGSKIAIAGSYGKTSMKELLLTVLSEGKKVAATPANKNVAASHAQFARTLQGDEDILMVEYGEGAPGDIARFARRTHPDYAIITGVAAAHLDRYRTVKAAGKDIFSLTKYVEAKHICVNDESLAAKPFITSGLKLYDRSGALGWKVSDVKVKATGLSFTLKKGKHELKLKSALLGRHQLGPLSLAAALAYEFGIPLEAIVRGISKTHPFEHRMQPYRLNSAWIIDDTYNGNLEGIRAGTELLSELPAKRKLYITPGLVDQGKETQQIHEEMGRLIASSGANVVVLMQNSVTDFIRHGLQEVHFKGELRIEPSPLQFYTNLDQFVAAGDIALLQNDWPDSYM